MHYKIDIIVELF